MAELPNLDTSTVGILAYWNAIDNGASEVNPENVLNIDNLQTYNQYDNGVQGTMKIWMRVGNPAGTQQNEYSVRTVHYRVKTDGWVLCWLDRTNEFNKNLSEGNGDVKPDGYYDIAHTWMRSQDDTKAFPNSTLQQAMSVIVPEVTPDAFGTTPSPTHYCYEYTNSNQLAIASESWYPGGNDSLSDTFSVGFEGTSTIDYHAFAGFGYNIHTYDSNYLRYSGVDVWTDGTDTNVDGVDLFGTFDGVAEGVAAADGTLYDTEVRLSYDSNGAKGVHVALTQV